MNAVQSPWAIETNGLTRDFGEFRAVDDVTFQVKRGSIFGFLGPNGSGKTTVVRMICGLLAASAGSATLDGLDVASNPKEIRTRFGYMNQKFSLYGDLTVRENLTFFGRCFGIRGGALKTRVGELLDLLGLKPYADRRAGMLSGGWKQRLSLGAALIHRPPVLFLDEPTAGIDPVARRDLWNLLFELSAQGITIFVTTHYMDEAERCSDIAYIYLSKLLVKGTPSSLKKLGQVTGPGERWTELYCSSPAHALPPVRSLPGVTEATIFGETLHLKVNNHFDQASLNGALGGIGQPDFTLRDVSPSLEDVFVSLTRQAAEAQHV
jgi:ABC-type multidrug transport system ATPase subunit